jgi:NADH-quinone oxidoreductase subunit M
MASVYALRLYIRTMHNRVAPGVQSREMSFRDGLVLVPLVAVIVFMALYPQLALRRSEASVKAAVASVSGTAIASTFNCHGPNTLGCLTLTSSAEGEP